MRSTKFVTIILLWGVISIFFLSGPVAALEDTASSFSQYETLLLEKLNWARTNPAAAAALVGIDSDQLSKTSENWRTVLSGGLPVLTPNEKLQQAARLHTQDMLDNHYYGYTSPAGLTIADRITAAGYHATYFGEMLGVVTFNNFMQPEAAVDNLIAQLIKRDLLLIDSENVTLFNPALNDVGIGMNAGLLTVGNDAYNAYILTCDFGALPPAHFGDLPAEYLFIDLVNQARMAPSYILSAYGIDLAALPPLSPVLAERLETGVPPVTYDASLREVAFDRNRAVFQNGVLDEAPGVAAVWDSGDGAGSDVPGVVGETAIGSISAVDVNTQGVIHQLFRELLMRELTAADETELRLFRMDVTEMGVMLGHRSEGEDAGRAFYLLTVAYGGEYLSTMGKQSLVLLNQARVNPDGIPAGALHLVSKGNETAVPPLIHNRTVFSTAAAHARDMVGKGYFDTYSYDGTQDVTDRLAQQGYPVSDAIEQIANIINEQPFDPVAGGIQLFHQMLTAQLPMAHNEYNLLDPAMKTAGIHFLQATPATDDVLVETAYSGFSRFHTLLLVVDIALPAVESEANMVCLVFRDVNGDGLYNRGEGRESIPVTLRFNDASYRFYTDSIGSIALPLARGTYDVEVAVGERVIHRRVSVDTENIMLFFPY